MIINHNISSIYAHRQMQTNQIAEAKDMEKLSSGLRINRSADDAAGLAISEKMRTQVRGLAMAKRNAQDGISFIQTTEGYLSSSQEMIQRMRELAIQASNGIYTHEDRLAIQVEISQLVDEIDRVASHAQFNTFNMLTGRFARLTTDVEGPTLSMWIHLGANMDQRERLYVQTMTALALGLKEAGTSNIICYSTQEFANRAIGTLDTALGKVSKQRADLGAYQNRLEFAIKGIMNNYENQQASEAQIRDEDMAQGSMLFAKDQILTQASLAMLAQSNMKPSMVLQLLR